MTTTLERDLKRIFKLSPQNAKLAASKKLDLCGWKPGGLLVARINGVLATGTIEELLSK